MSARMVVLLAVLAAFWILGLIGQFHSPEAAMRYLALSMADPSPWSACGGGSQSPRCAGATATGGIRREEWLSITRLAFVNP